MITLRIYIGRRDDGAVGFCARSAPTKPVTSMETVMGSFCDIALRCVIASFADLHRQVGRHELRAHPDDHRALDGLLREHIGDMNAVLVASVHL